MMLPTLVYCKRKARCCSRAEGNACLSVSDYLYGGRVQNVYLHVEVIHPCPEQLCCIDSIAIGPPPDTERRGFALGALKLPCSSYPTLLSLSMSHDSKL